MTLSLLILLVWKLKQHLSGMAGAPGGTAQAWLSLETPTSHLSPPAVGTAALCGEPPYTPCMKQTHPHRLGGCPRPPARRGGAGGSAYSEPGAGSTVQRGGGGCRPPRLPSPCRAVGGLLVGAGAELLSAGVWAAVCWGQGCRAAFMGEQRGWLLPGPTVVWVGGGSGPRPCPKAQRVSNTHPLPAQPWEGKNLFLGHAFGPQWAWDFS